MYEVVVHDQAQATVDVLPGDAVPGYFKVLELLELAPWGGRPWGGGNPDSNILTLPFSDDGMVTYMVLERDREVHVLEVQWVG